MEKGGFEYWLNKKEEYSLNEMSGCYPIKKT
jgi:hypothetical protein